MDYSGRSVRNIHLQTEKGGEKVKKMVFRTVVAAVLCFVVTLSAAAAQMLVPVGKVVGLSLVDGSVTVVAFDETLGTDLHQALKKSDGSVKLTVKRNRQEHTISVNPAVSDQGPRLGVYIREGVTGIGTVTYYDPDSGTFGALGHGVSDSRGKLAQMNSGCIYQATVTSVRQGVCGKPGQLRGSVSASQPIGNLQINCGSGVFGSCEAFSGEALPTGQAQVGPAKILSNVNGDAVETFSVEITKLYDCTDGNGRDLMLKVTDSQLLDTTGGIVAGMSGSPILQDGKLVGAVTHVLVNDPQTGYGIFIENMLEAAG